MTEKKYGWLHRLLYDLYEVTIWFKNEDGTKTKKIFVMSEIKTINQNHLKGKNDQGHRVEIKTEQKFDYFVKKLF